jgi:hypothetical protein
MMDNKVDFGLWKTIPMSGLMIPLDVHVEKICKKICINHEKTKRLANGQRIDQ